VVERARIVDLYNGRVRGYVRDPRRPAPHNLYARSSQLLAQAPGASKARELSASTVVIQYTKVRTSRFLEAGARPPYAESTGAGTGLVLRGGQAYAVRWSRPDADGGTTFTTASGQPMTFARGPVLVVLAAAP
jgi:hypothetical protein